MQYQTFYPLNKMNNKYQRYSEEEACEAIEEDGPDPYAHMYQQMMGGYNEIPEDPEESKQSVLEEGEAPLKKQKIQDERIQSEELFLKENEKNSDKNSLNGRKSVDKDTNNS